MDACPIQSNQPELTEALIRLANQQSHKPSAALSVLPAVISGLTVICAVVGMLWSFMLNQNTFQVTNGQKLDMLTVTLNEIRKNADQVPLIALQLNQIDQREKEDAEARKIDERKLTDISETLARMGVRTAK